MASSSHDCQVGELEIWRLILQEFVSLENTCKRLGFVQDHPLDLQSGNYCSFADAQAFITVIIVASLFISKLLLVGVLNLFC